MIRISINKAIYRYGGISEEVICEQLKAATPGEEIEISINSPGGEVYEGIAIFNLIREYAKSHNVIVKITGLAASMASYIAIAARTINKNSKIIVYENSIFLIHNPWNIIMGDYREFKKAADYLERLAAMASSTYAYITGKPEKETRDLMDAETYFVGNEIIENNFANEFEKINQAADEPFELDRNTLIINAKLQIERTAESLRKNSKADLEKAVALITNTIIPSLTAEAPAAGANSIEPTAGSPTSGGSVHLNSPVNPGEKNHLREGDEMDKDKLKRENPELYALIYGEGKEAGVKEERERVNAHLKLGEESGAMKIAAQFIRDGKSVMENSVYAEYFSAKMNNGAFNARNADDPPAITPPNGESADEAALEAAWNLGIAGKEFKGGK
jgi:ATP-dependent protease ClpP protease subunit